MSSIYVLQNDEQIIDNVILTLASNIQSIFTLYLKVCLIYGPCKQPTFKKILSLVPRAQRASTYLVKGYDTVYFRIPTKWH